MGIMKIFSGSEILAETLKQKILKLTKTLITPSRSNLQIVRCKLGATNGKQFRKHMFSILTLIKILLKHIKTRINTITPK